LSTASLEVLERVRAEAAHAGGVLALRADEIADRLLDESQHRAQRRCELLRDGRSARESCPVLRGRVARPPRLFGLRGPRSRPVLRLQGVETAGERKHLVGQPPAAPAPGVVAALRLLQLLD